MSARTFVLHTRSSGRERKVRCVVYDELRQMQVAAEKWSGEDHSKTLAVSQPSYAYILEEDGTEIGQPGAGYIRLARERMGGTIVSHEALHMALAIYRDDWQAEHGPPENSMENEEVLCHIMSDLIDEAIRKFYKAGIYP